MVLGSGALRTIAHTASEESHMRTCSLVFGLATMLALVPSRLPAQPEHEHDHAHSVPERLGSVHFPTSCRRALQPTFERGVALLHSFAYAEAAKTFEEVAAKDPHCGMAYWGIAM